MGIFDKLTHPFFCVFTERGTPEREEWIEMRTQYTRVKALVLAVMLAIMSVPFQSVTAQAAVTKPTLTFVGTPRADEAYVITGTSVSVYEEIPRTGNYHLNGLVLTNNDNSQPVTNPKDKGFDMTGLLDLQTYSATRLIRVDSGFNPTNPDNKNTNSNAALSGEYSLSSNFYSTVMEGNTYYQQNLDGTRQSAPTAVYTTDNQVTQPGRIRVQCLGNEQEGSGQMPAFKVLTDVDNKATGSFAMFAEEVHVNKLEGDKLQFEIWKGESYHIYIEADRLIENPAVLDTDGVTVLKPADKLIKQGTVFEFNYSRPLTQSLLLRVLTPQAAVQEVEHWISSNKSSNGTGSLTDQSNFIHLDQTKNPRLNNITESFQLRHFLKKEFGGDFEIKWEWTPTHIFNSEDQEYVPLNSDGVKIWQNVVRIGGDDDWALASVNRTKMEENIKGVLKATVTCTSVNYKSISTSPEIEIEVRGMGKDPELHESSEKYGQLDGQNDGYEKDLGDAKLTDKVTAKTMNAYQGGIDKADYPVATDKQKPYQYVLNINMGEKNGAVHHVEVRTGGDADAVKLEYFNEKKGASGGWEEYIPNTKQQIENPLYNVAGNTTPGEVLFRITAKEHGAKAPKFVNLYFDFCQPEDTGSSRYEPVDEYGKEIDLTIWDTTPSRISSLKKLIIKDQNGNIIDWPTTANTQLGTKAGEFDGSILSYHDDLATGYKMRVHLPYKSKSITLTPELTEPNASVGGKHKIEFSMVGPDRVTKVLDSGDYSVLSGATTSPIDVFEDENGVGRDVYTLTVVSPCEDPRRQYWTTYTIEIIRDEPSTDDALSSIEIFYVDKDGKEVNIADGFDPDGRTGTGVTKENKDTYEWFIPYSVTKDRLRVPTPKTRNSNAEGPVIAVNSSATLECELPYQEKFPDGTFLRQWINNLRIKYRSSGEVLTVTYEVKSEALAAEKPDAEGPRVYTVNIHRLPPNTDATLKALDIADGDDLTREDRTPLKFNPDFRPNGDAFANTYSLEIPFSTATVSLRMDPTDKNVTNILVYGGSANANTLKADELIYSLKKPDDLSQSPFGAEDGDLVANRFGPSIAVPAYTDPSIRSKGYYPIYVKVYAEDESVFRTYEIRVKRAEPSDDATLKSLELFDQNNVTVNTFEFRPNLDPQEYHVTVPYETTGVMFLPTMNYEVSNKMQPIKIEVEPGNPLFKVYNSRIANKQLSTVKNLAEPGKERHFRLTVGAENAVWENSGVLDALFNDEIVKSGDSKTYDIYITRELPSDDARLKGLVASDTTDFSPLFISSKTEYTATLNTGAPGTFITATTNHPGATVKIDGKVVRSGTPSELVELIEVKQTVKVEVTAQDGKTKMVYNILFTNDNLIEKTSNADLKRLTVNYGQMTPTFKAAVTEYEVTVKENAWSVDLIPRVSDPLATMRVLNGTRELGDYRGNYALALVDGENQVTVEVTSPDKTVVKNYDISIFRDEEEKLKNLTPLEDEDIDWVLSGNPIIVKIEEYPRVGASVFNTLREEYPEKSIIFQGNDYSIRFDGKNLSRVIPQTEIYDFRMTFDSPDEDAIYDLIEDYQANDDIVDDVVLCYFDYHGSLPGPASFQLSLGRRYANETLYWHYYNQERDRIDYYGSLRSNTKGTVAVSMDHFSTYIVSPLHRIAGSEDKDGIIDQLGMISNGKDLLGSGGKLNPDTGVREDRP